LTANPDPKGFEKLAQYKLVGESLRFTFPEADSTAIFAISRANSPKIEASGKVHPTNLQAQIGIRPLCGYNRAI
jgi:hypothetical protein